MGNVRFYEEAITAECREALGILKGQSALSDFYLAGGTALALQIGHRISTDLDWFSFTRHLEIEERDALRSALSQSGRFEVQREQDGQLFTRLAGADVSFIYQHHPLLQPTVNFDGVPLASPVDIGVMKLAAYTSS
ncbi:MAG: nucleotidyl transferase AbiEii/AbiGii toxin family protein [Chloroflexota bacterium]